MPKGITKFIFVDHEDIDIVDFYMLLLYIGMNKWKNGCNWTVNILFPFQL